MHRELVPNAPLQERRSVQRSVAAGGCQLRLRRLPAAGPGHGKAVISSYVLADGQTVRRGVLLSFMAALIQAFSALVLVAVLMLVLRSTGLQIRVMEAWLETLSWGLWRWSARGSFTTSCVRYPRRRVLAPHGGHDHGGHDHAHATTTITSRS